MLRFTYRLHLASVLFLCLIVFTAGSAGSADAIGPFVIGGSYDYPPYSFVDEAGQMQGFSTDLSRALIATMDLSGSIQLSSWSEALRLLQSGEIALVHDIVYSSERAQQYHFSAPYHVSTYAVFAGQSAPALSDMTELPAASIVVVANDIGHEYLISQGLEHAAVVVSDYPKAILAVNSGEYPYTMMDRLVGLYWIQDLDAAHITTTDLSPFTLRYAFAAVDDRHLDLIMAINGGLALLWQSGQYEEIYDRWMAPLENNGILLNRNFLISWGLIFLSVLIALLLGLWALRREVANRTKELEQELELRIRSEEHARSIIEVLPDIIAWVSKDGIINRIHASSSRQMFLDRHTMPGHHLGKFYPPNVVSTLMTSIKQALATGSMQQVEYQMVLPNNSYAYYEARILQVNAEEVVAFVRNITDQAEADKALQQSQETLEQERLLLRMVLDHVPSSIYVKDRQSRKTLTNSSDLALIGKTHEQDVLGKTDFDFFPYDSAIEGYQEEQKLMETGVPILNKEDRVFLPDGKQRWILTSKLPLRNRDGEIIGLVGIGHDIHDRKQAQESLLHLTYHDPLTNLYNRRYLHERMETLDADGTVPVAVIMADVNGLKIINDSLGHTAGDQLLTTAASIMSQSARPGDVIARTGGDEFVILLPGIGSDGAEAICRSIQARAEARSKGPLRLSISVGHAERTDPEEPLDSVLQQAEDYMYRDKSANVQSSRSALVRSLLIALQEKSHETEDHARNMQGLAEELAVRIGMTQREINEVSLLAALHDLGKVAIPEPILRKPAPLTEDEWTIMRRHPEIGQRIALASPELASVADGIHSHHERWDGKGYPRGLAGEEIPLPARIVSIVDAFDAMISDRPYSASKPVHEALLELERCAGSQFDPGLVSEFLALLAEEPRLAVRR